MKENVIISLADANYFELLNELVDSIKRFKESKNTAICIMDAGLTDEQKSVLSTKVDEIKPAGLISSTLVDNTDFCSSVNPASIMQIAVFLLSLNLLIESTNSFNNSK